LKHKGHACLEQVANLGVRVHDAADRVDQAHDLLRHVVRAGGLAAEDAHARHELGALLRRGGLDRVVAVDEGEDVEVLALVFVDALDLDVVQRVARQLHARQRLIRHTGERLIRQSCSGGAFFPPF
jgi:hypothetical protein